MSYESRLEALRLAVSVADDGATWQPSRVTDAAAAFDWFLTTDPEFERLLAEEAAMERTPPPEPIAVGDTVEIPIGLRAVVLATHDGWAWVDVANYPAPSCHAIADLKRVEP